MNSESSRRRFLRHATVAGAALVAGAGVTSITGCCNDEKKRVQALETENSQLKDQLAHTTQMSVDADGNLVIPDVDGNKDIRQRLGQVWESQHPQKGIHVLFSYDTEAPSGTGPENNKVNSLCSC